MAYLYLNSYYTSAYKTDRRIEIRVLNKEKGNTDIHYVPFDDVSTMIVTGNPTISTAVIATLLKMDVPIHFLSSSGSWRGSLTGFKSGNAQRRIMQYDFYRSEMLRLEISRNIIELKIKNSRRALQKLAGNRQQSDSLPSRIANSDLQTCLNSLTKAKTLDEIRGLEGYAATIYFKRLSDFLPSEFPFEKRSRQPPLNEVNAALSWTYTIVLAELEAQVRIHNLDPAIGFFHELSYNTPSLALDLLEIFRAPLCDLLILKMFNHKIFNKSHFEPGPEKIGVYMSEAGRKLFFANYERHMLREFTPYKGAEHTSFRKLLKTTVIEFCKIIESGEIKSNFFSMP